MSTHGSFNAKNPTIKRILKEASELSTSPSADYSAAPLENNIFEFHFTVRGPPEPSPYAAGLYHGRIVLPPQYPLRPPSFRFLTPSGRFEVNREICLSISGHHEESWQPAWGIRTALVAIRTFMDSDAKGQVGGIDSNSEVRLRLARESRTWKCTGCAKSNEDIMHEREAEVGCMDEKTIGEETIPHELQLGYRDELGKDKAKNEGSDGISRPVSITGAATHSPNIENHANAADLSTARTTSADPAPATIEVSSGQHIRARSRTSTNWLDVAIGGVAVALLVMILRRIAHSI